MNVLQRLIDLMLILAAVLCSYEKGATGIEWLSHLFKAGLWLFTLRTLFAMVLPGVAAAIVNTFSQMPNPRSWAFAPASENRHWYAEAEQWHMLHYGRTLYYTQSQPAVSDAHAYQVWRINCDKFFANPLHYRRMPQPSYWRCDKLGCRNKQHLYACAHSLRRLFSATNDSPGVLRAEQRRWHPNRAIFHQLEAQGMPGCVAFATEIWQVIQSLSSTQH